MSENEKLQAIREQIGRLALESALLLMNRVLEDARSTPQTPADEGFVPPHAVHFLTKELLIHGNAQGLLQLDPSGLKGLISTAIQIDDPIQYDPDWKHANPLGFLERLLAQQIPAQNHILLQKIGLALGLYRDVGVVEYPVRFDLRAEIESALGLSVQAFMQMGFVVSALRSVVHSNGRCAGTFTHMTLAKAFSKNSSVCTPENWRPFLSRVACSQDRFREVARDPAYAVDDVRYEAFAFNPLLRFPITELCGGRFVAVDPTLIIERVTLGLFYDLFERGRTKFSQQFGYALEQFVGNLLDPVCKPGSLRPVSDWEKTMPSKSLKGVRRVDWVFQGDDSTVLIECKSLRPSLELTKYGSETALDSLFDRVAGAVEQLSGHSDSMQRGEWASWGLRPGPTLGVIVTYGKLFTINSSIARDGIRRRLMKKGIEPIPYVVLSLEELDSLVRILELGSSLDSAVAEMTEQLDESAPLAPFMGELSKDAVSSGTRRLGSLFFESATEDGG